MARMHSALHFSLNASWHSLTALCSKPVIHTTATYRVLLEEKRTSNFLSLTGFKLKMKLVNMSRSEFISLWAPFACVLGIWVKPYLSKTPKMLHQYWQDSAMNLPSHFCMLKSMTGRQMPKRCTLSSKHKPNHEFTLTSMKMSSGQGKLWRRIW